MKRNLYLAVTAITMLLASCTIQQRVYQPGLSIEWKGVHQRQTKSNVEQALTEQESTNEIQLSVPDEGTASNENEIAPTAAETAANVASIAKDRNDSKKEVKQAINEFKKEVSSLIANDPAAASVDLKSLDIQNHNKPHAAWVYILLIFFLPFGTTYSVFLYEGSWTKKVTTNLILTLLCGIPGLIHALVTIFGKK